MDEPTATATRVADPNHPDGTDPNGDIAETASQPTTEAAPTKRRKQTKYEQVPGLSSLTLPDSDVTYLNPDNGRFRVGHDAKLKSRLIGEQLDIEARATEGQDVTDTDQYKMLAALGWLSHLDASRAARANRKSRKPAPKDGATQTDTEEAGSADRIEQGKAAKEHAMSFVDQAVDLGEARGRFGRVERKLGKVLRVKRTDEQDVLSPWVAHVAVPDDPRNPDGPFTETEILVAQLQLAS